MELVLRLLISADLGPVQLKIMWKDACKRGAVAPSPNNELRMGDCGGAIFGFRTQLLSVK
jgi:hypothetical protein